jgi:hypothetical protein
MFAANKHFVLNQSLVAHNLNSNIAITTKVRKVNVLIICTAYNISVIKFMQATSLVLTLLFYKRLCIAY